MTFKAFKNLYRDGIAAQKKFEALIEDIAELKAELAEPTQ